MNDFAHLLDRLAYEPRRNAKLRLLQDYFAHAPDPERGYALAAMTGGLTFREAKPAMIRGLVEARIDPVLFALSHNYVGDLAETTALIWPAPAPISENVGGSPESGRHRGSPLLEGEGQGEVRDLSEDGPHLTPTLSFQEREVQEREPVAVRPGRRPKSAPGGNAADAAPAEEGGPNAVASIGHNNPPPHVPTLAEVVETLGTVKKADLPGRIAEWLDALDETGRWALLKLITGALRVGVSARLAKTAIGALGGHEADAVEEVWHGLEPPYATLFAWVGGAGRAPDHPEPGPVPAAHAIPPHRRGRGFREARPRPRSRASGSGTASGSSSSAGATKPAPRWRGSTRARARTSRARFRISPRPSPSTAPSTANS